MQKKSSFRAFLALLGAGVPCAVLVGCSGGSSSSLLAPQSSTLFSNLAIPLDQNRVGTLSGTRTGDDFVGTLDVPPRTVAAGRPQTSLLRLLIDAGRYPIRGRFSNNTAFSGQGEVKVSGTPTPLALSGALPSGTTSGSVTLQVGGDSTSTVIPVATTAPTARPTTSPTAAPTTSPIARFAGVYNGAFRNTSGPDIGETGALRISVNNAGDATVQTLRGSVVEDTFTGRVGSNGQLAASGRTTEGVNVGITVTLQSAALSRSTGSYSVSDGNRGVFEVVKAGATNPFAQFAGTYVGTYTFTNGPESGQSGSTGFTINSTGLLTLPTESDVVVAQLQTNGQVAITERIEDEGVTIVSTLEIRAGGRGTVSTGTFSESNGVRGTLRVVKQ